ncbi:unnamed protein product [Lathyrus oleraceus]
MSRYSAASTDNEIPNELLAHSEESYTKMLCHVIDKIYLIPIELEHDRELDCFYVDPKDIKDMVFGNWWLDIGLLQFWCVYTHRICRELNKPNIYGFLDLVGIPFIKNSTKKN